MKILSNTINYLSCNIFVSVQAFHGAMLTIKPIFISIFALGVSSCYTPPNPAPRAAPEGDYILDPAHTSIVWSINHVGLSNYTARFDRASGALQFNPETPEKSQVEIIIDPTSVNTGDPEFDQEIANKSSYFNATEFPQIRFISTSLAKTGDNSGKMTGDLSFRGVTVPLTLDIVFNGAGKSFGHKGKTLGFSATGSLKRSEFGLTTLESFGIGDEVSLVIETEFNEK